MSFIDFWQEYVLFSGMKFSDWVLDVVSDALGEFAGFVAFAIALPITIGLILFGVFATGALMIAAVVASPMILPVTIYLHMRNRP